MLQANRDLRPSQVREILCNTASKNNPERQHLLVADPGSTSNEFGSGLVDATAAVEAALNRALLKAAS